MGCQVVVFDLNRYKNAQEKVEVELKLEMKPIYAESGKKIKNRQ
jgi:hypothetical protein